MMKIRLIAAGAMFFWSMAPLAGPGPGGGAGLVRLSPGEAAAAPHTYRVDSAASSFVIHVGRSGLLKVAGHEHDVIASRFSGEVTADREDPAHDSVLLTFPAAGLTVDPAREPRGDAPKVQAAMAGPRCLDVARYPEIVFRSTAIQATAQGDTALALRITGNLSLHGVTRLVTIPVKARITGNTLTARGTAVIRQRDFGIEPISAAGGTVKTTNELTLLFRIVARE